MAKYKIGDKVFSNEKGLPNLDHRLFQNRPLTIIGYDPVIDSRYLISGTDGDGNSLTGCYTTDEYISPAPAVEKVSRQKKQRANYRLNQEILKHLQSGKSISPMEALVVHGCMRLAAAICDLRQAGHNIKTDIHHDSKGKQYARYSLVAERIAA